MARLKQPSRGVGPKTKAAGEKKRATATAEQVAEVEKKEKELERLLAQMPAVARNQRNKTRAAIRRDARGKK